MIFLFQSQLFFMMVAVAARQHYFFTDFFVRKPGADNSGNSKNSIDPPRNIFTKYYQVNISRIKNKNIHCYRPENRFFLPVIFYKPCYN